MFVVVTIEGLYYGAPIFTYASYEAAYAAGRAVAGWFEIERVY